ncbi:N-acetylmuramoyl-L-alanine amidase [Desulfothermobacter acidiphilus]|uniref:N-acetylmuramoyl-L-alanine amidase n=1 Tax=Desulfothermobacter acidiphilus TaxID=1938353 RepID=UPI003F896C02
MVVKWCKWLWVPLLLLVLFLPLPAQAAGMVEVTGDVVNLRAGPGTDYPVLGQVEQGTQLAVIGEARGWYNVLLADGRRAFIAGWLVRLLEPAALAAPSRGIQAQQERPSTASAAGPSTVEVTGDVVNLRAGPGTDYPVLGQVEQGAQLAVIGEARGWYNVLLADGRRAFIAGWLVSGGGAAYANVPLVSRGGENRPLPSVLAGKKIVIDPGHGGSDPGAIGPTGYQEKAFTLAVARLLATKLRERGAQVLLTRDSDVTLDLAPRVEKANCWEADAFLSIHANASTDSSVAGLSTWYCPSGFCPKGSSYLARCVQEAMVQELQLPDLGVRTANFYVVRYTQMPAVLAEVGFISNPGEESLLRTPEFQERVAQALVSGLERFFAP